MNLVGHGRQSVAEFRYWWLALCTLLLSGCGEAPPYPPSDTIGTVTFDWRTHIRRAPGSDNWATTWADHGRQYTTWGDGGGFGGTDRVGRASLGVARIDGEFPDFVAINIFGGKRGSQPSRLDGKSYGLLAVDDRLLMWVSPGSGESGYRHARLYTSVDGGQQWVPAQWRFDGDSGLAFPAFLQAGRGYLDGGDYLYIYFIGVRRSDRLAIQKPGEIFLARVPRAEVQSRSAYRFFAGAGADAAPRWAADIGQRQPVFRDPAGVGWTVSVTRLAHVGRYLLMTEHGRSFGGELGMFEAEQPWGPWRTVYYGPFGHDRVEPTAFYYNLAPAWSGADGSFVLLFTGIRSNDSFNAVAGRFAPGPATDRTTPRSDRHVPAD